ncbi:PF13665 domain protein [Caballeronia terrestris]|uniref:PF13665 domain protein n=1 Tax=Caballeronia terrestris TaxID=1226301 RepID=A0A158KQL8_9BURK|nr:DUF4150 domain-containing protein [Caballeronia terrestris]SAL83438.1 PF13665 domain protein [Caballeronia terrestris]
MPTHIIVNGLGLTYKGTVGVSTATIPDVCKTPSPGGPVPIPYPNFAQQSSLEDGTTTVFAKGEMIAVKGSHYSSSFGDEAGTAGGVKSNVNMKATDWITYSFDVKMDGKNACRHTDKKFHNNQNTVDLAGNVDPGISGGNPLLIDCKDAPKSSPTKFSDCEKEEICAKCAAINATANAAIDSPQPGKSNTGPYRGHKRIGEVAYEINRADGDYKCAKLNKEARAGNPANLGFHDRVSDKCKEALKSKAEPNYKGFSPDHANEIQLGGHPTCGQNLRWMSSGPNSWMGGEMKKFRAPHDWKGRTEGGPHTGLAPNCC